MDFFVEIVIKHDKTQLFEFFMDTDRQTIQLLEGA